jgi:hypothetical protein
MKSNLYGQEAMFMFSCPTSLELFDALGILMPLETTWI